MKKQIIAMLLLAVLTLSACGKKETAALETPGTNTQAEVTEPEEEEKEEEEKDRYERMVERNPNIATREVLPTDIESLPEEWQREAAKKPAAIIGNLDILGVQLTGEKAELRQYLEEHPEDIIPLILLISEAYERLGKDSNGNPAIENNTPENIAEIEEFCDNLLR